MLTERAERHQAKSAERHAAAESITAHIPFGQPILVGHHSQARSERDAARVNANFAASIAHHQER